MPQAPPSLAVRPTATGAPTAAASSRWATPAVRNMPPCANIVSSSTPSAAQHPHAQAQGAERAVDLRAHEVGERQPAVRGAHEQRAPLGQPGDRLAGQVVVGEQPAAVGVAVERLAQQRAEDVVGARPACPRAAANRPNSLGPRAELARAVVAVHHRDQVAGRAW